MSKLRWIVDAVHEAFNTRRFDRLEDLYEPNARLIVSGQLVQGRAAVIDYAMTARHVPGMRLELDEVLAETEDTIVVHTRAVAGASAADDASAPRADRQALTVCKVFRVAGDRIIEARLYIDPGSLATARLVAEQSALRRVAELVARGAENQQVFDQVTIEASRLLDDAPTVLFRYERSGSEVKVLARSLPPDMAREETYYTVGASLPVPTDSERWHVWQTGRASRIDSYAQLTDTGVAAAGVAASVAAPITVEGRLWGVLIAASHGPPLPAGTEERLSQFTDLVATALANTQNRAELIASRARLMAGADEARRQLARDVHDGAQRRLVHALIAVKQGRAALSEDEVAAAKLLDETLRQTQAAYEELRQLAHGILPAALEHGGLRTAVEALVADVPLAVETDVLDARLPEAVETTAYFLVSEALTNTIKHAAASRMRVRAVRAGDVLTVEVTDDGRGGAQARIGGSGLYGLNDRVEAAGGTISVTSPPGAGTTIAATLPITTPETE